LARSGGLRISGIPPLSREKRTSGCGENGACFVGQINYVNQNKFRFVKPSHEKDFSSVFQQISALIRCPASMKRGERVVTIVGRDAMDVMVPRDERRPCMRQRRVVLAPLGWC
jgi:hypothetical protein